MFSVLCHNDIDGTYTVIDWNDVQIDRLTPIEFWSCVNKLSFNINGVDRSQGVARVNTLSLLDSKYFCRTLPNDGVVLEQTAYLKSNNSNERNLQVMLFDSKTGMMRNLLLSINYNVATQPVSVGKVAYKTLDLNQIFIGLDLHIGNETVGYFYVMGKDYIKVYTSGAIPKGSKITFDYLEKMLLVDGKSVYKWG